MLFADGDWIKSAWQLVTPILEAWAAEQPRNFPNYAAGSWGPAEAESLLSREGRQWHTR